MRINLLITELRTGGAERCLTELAIGLKARGDSVRIMSLAPLPLPPRNELVSKLLDEGIPIQSVGVRRLRQLFSAVSAVRQWMLEDPPDVLQTFLYHANVVGSLASRRDHRWLVFAGVRVAQPSWGRVWVESQLMRRLSGVVCVSHAVENFVRRAWQPPARLPVVTIRNGIRGERLDNSQAVDWTTVGLRPGGEVVLFLGRLHRQKGLDLLLDVAPTLLRMHPQLRLAIVGEGPLKSMVTRSLQQLPAGSAALLPWQADVAELYAGARIVILPSRYEGMPNVVLEAMAAARCVVASDVEGVSELLGPLAPPQTFPPGDRASMVQRLDALLRRDDLAELGQANRERTLSEFSIDAMVERYRQLYQDTLAR
ncbi:glycosyltransferase [Planctomycetaceae bacterium SH139]